MKVLDVRLNTGVGYRAANLAFDGAEGELVAEESHAQADWRIELAPGGDAGFINFSGVEGDGVIVFEERTETKVDDELTISVWVRADFVYAVPDPYRQKEIISRGGGNLSFGWEQGAAEDLPWLRAFLRDSTSATLNLEIRDDAGNTSHPIGGSNGWRDGKWRHLALRFSPVGKLELGEIWVDGVMQEQHTSHGLIDLRVSSTSDHWVIGGRRASSGAIDRNFDGDVARVLMFDEWKPDDWIRAEAGYPSRV